MMDDVDKITNKNENKRDVFRWRSFALFTAGRMNVRWTNKSVFSTPANRTVSSLGVYRILSCHVGWESGFGDKIFQ